MTYYKLDLLGLYETQKQIKEKIFARTHYFQNISLQKNNCKDFYKITKQLCIITTSSCRTIRDKDNNPIIATSQQLKRWEGYF